MNKSVRTILVSLFLALGVFALLNSMGSQGGALNFGQPKIVTLDYSKFMERVEKGEIKTAVWSGNRITGETKTGGKYEAKINNISPDGMAGAQIQDKLTKNGVELSFPDPWVNPMVMNGLMIFALLLSPFLIFYFMFYRPAQQGGNQAMSFGRSRARRHGENGPKITFDDVAGIDEAKTELMEIVDFLKNTKKYVALGAKIPKGILLTGPPGVGKTHLARAVAGEAGVPFYHISGSDFVEMFVGVGAARVRDLFETAKAHRPCLIFVDEIDAVGRQRGAGLGGGHDEREQTLNQLLVEMDGFDANQGVIMIAATNRPDVLDPALLRPGRFDRQIVVDAPDAKGRELILNIHGKGKPFDSDVDMKTIAKRTPGFTGADLANALNESALLTARRNKTKISMEEVEESLDRVMVGAARRSRTILDKDREITAYHEAGHAIVGELLPNCDPVHKVTILPRGMALGLTWSLPDTEKLHVSRSELLDDIAMALGGLVAEEVVYGERWTGAVSDLDRVTRIARAMVCNYGMSDRLGTLVLGRGSRNPFLGRDFYDEHDYSEEVARMIDEEVRQIVDGQHARAKMLLEENREKMDTIVQVLLERETIVRNEFLEIMGIDPENDPKITKSDPEDASDDSVEAISPPMPQKPPRLEPGPA
ncbi:MAG: ATP-dependent zinc metalloprotease FtsH [Fimbriimonadaceae bacterium]|nr:ATP-dependent zinc metalloprotease FtsH [Fimbriimonadaceae bacterium]